MIEGGWKAMGGNEWFLIFFTGTNGMAFDKLCSAGREM